MMFTDIPACFHRHDPVGPSRPWSLNDTRQRVEQAAIVLAEITTSPLTVRRLPKDRMTLCFRVRDLYPRREPQQESLLRFFRQYGWSVMAPIFEDQVVEDPFTFADIETLRPVYLPEYQLAYARPDGPLALRTFLDTPDGIVFDQLADAGVPDRFYPTQHAGLTYARLMPRTSSRLGQRGYMLRRARYLPNGHQTYTKQTDGFCYTEEE
jgi:hypothetical protein